jgi:hypothetical protein
MDDPQIPFIPGLDLSQKLYEQAVRPLMARAFPRLAYTAALIGYGSDVIGFDTPMSRDHMWGPRLILFFTDTDYAQNSAAVDAALRSGLPHSIDGYPTNFGAPDLTGVRLPVFSVSGPVDHLIQRTTIATYFDGELGAGRWRDPTPDNWLTFSEHRLLTLTAGRVYHDDLGLEDLRRALAYYPRPVWLYLLSSEWSKIGQEEPFVGRTGGVEDDLGSRILAARLVHTCMRLGFLLERRYAPYSKWFGAGFARLEIAPALTPFLRQALASQTWQERGAALCAAYETLAARQNALAIIPPVEARCSGFHDRPFQVIHGERIAAALQAQIEDPLLRTLRPFGSVNQFSASTDFLEETSVLEKLTVLYQ